MEVHARDPIAQAVVLLIDKKALIPLIDLLNPDYPLWLIKRYGFVDLLVDEKFELSLILDFFGDFLHALIEGPFDVLRVLPVVVPEYLCYLISELRLLHKEVLGACSGQCELILFHGGHRYKVDARCLFA